MPYCTKCGAEVTSSDRFCRRCGGAQPATGPSGQRNPSANNISPRAASILCYVPWLGWIASLFILATARFRADRDVRFHAYQGLYLYVAWLVVHWVVGPWQTFLPGPHVPFDTMLKLVVVVVWIIMLVKTSRGERYSLPVLGELAERSL